MRRGITTTLLVVFSLLCTPHIIAYPTGIGEEADNGCLCHGIAEESVSINITGIPEKWESNTTYTISFSVSNNDVNQDRGGFRLLISDGELNYSSEKVQELDGGLTHTSNGSQQRNWSVIWTSPQNANKTVIFKLLVNAVNGDGTSNGDDWAMKEISVQGVDAKTVQESVSGFAAAEYGGLLVVVVGIAFLVKMMYSRPEELGEEHKYSIDEFD